MARLIIAGLAVCGLAAPACAFEYVSGGLPTFAQESGALTAGAAGSLTRTGSFRDFPGFTTSGSSLRISNNLTLGVSTTAGSTPFSFGTGAMRGFDLSSTSVKLGYDIGRLTPFISASISSMQQRAVPGLPTGFNTTGDLLAGRSDPKTSASVGAGFNYAISDSLQVGVSASFGTARPIQQGW